MISSPHSGEEVPEEVTWLKGLEEEVLMCDVDRYVDQLYVGVASQFNFLFFPAKWHRYVVDLNRLDMDVDELSVTGGVSPGGFPVGMGVHWAETTQGFRLMKSPLSLSSHQEIIKKYHAPFWDFLRLAQNKILEVGYREVFHLDVHSMPSRATEKHRDAGKSRPQIVVSDREGKSCSSFFKDIVIRAYEEAGFQVAYNFPYKGGRITESFGVPLQKKNTLQVELNRSLYMNESSKQKAKDFLETQQKISVALEKVYLAINKAGFNN